MIFEIFILFYIKFYLNHVIQIINDINYIMKIKIKIKIT